MTESDPEKEERQKEDQDREAALNAAPATHPEIPIELPAETPAATPSDPPKDMSIEPNKRLSDTEPEELVHALRHVFSGNDEKPKINSAPINEAEATQAERQQNPPSPAKNPKAAEAKSGYTNPFALFADVFYGVLIAPRQTLLILSDSSKFPPTLANLFLTFILVLVALALPAAIKLGHTGSIEAVLKASAFIFANLINWTILAFILYYLSIWLRGNRLTVGNAFIATGWAYLPFAFFAPVACFKSAMGNGFTVFACLPALWFMVLQWLAFQTSLRTTTIKLALIALVVPPVFCLVYLFWIGLAVFSLLAQLLSHLT